MRRVSLAVMYDATRRYRISILTGSNYAEADDCFCGNC